MGKALELVAEVDPRGARLVDLGVSLRAQGQDAELKSLDAWQMENIYD